MKRFAMNLTVIMLEAIFILLTVSIPVYSAECPEKTTVNVNSRNGAYPKDNSIDWSNIKKILAVKDSSIGVTSYALYIANFDFSENTRSKISKLKLTEGQGMLSIWLVNQVKGQREVNFKPGKYDFSKAQGQAEQTGSVGIRVAGTKISFSYHYTEGEFEVTSVSEQELCGKFTLKDKFSQVSGEFKAPVK